MNSSIHTSRDAKIRSRSGRRGNKEANTAIELLKQKKRDEAITHFNTALNHYEAISDEVERKTELSIFATLLNIVGFPELSIIAVQQAIELDEQLDDRPRLVEDIISYGNAQLHLGNREEALSIFNQALELCLTNHFYANAASASTNIAGIMYNRGQTDKAITMMYQSLDYLEQEPFPETERITRVGLTQALEQEGRSPEEIFSVARPVVQFADGLQPVEWEAIRSSLEQTVSRYLSDHPGVNAITVKRGYLPGLF